MAIEDKIILNSLSSVRRIEDVFIKDIESTLRKLERNLTPLLDQYRILPAADAALATQELQGILQQSGFYETTGRLLNDGYQQAIDEVQNIYFQTVGENLQFSPASLERLTSLRNLDFGEYSKLADGFNTTMTRTLMDVNFGAIDTNTATKILQSQVDNLGNHATTWVTTGLSGIYRESSMLLAQDQGFTKFEYVGPFDKITRPFCRNLLSGKRVYTIDEINAMDNGQGLSVKQYGGGFNCRHQWIGVK
jgi:hypothetical protein